MKLSAKTKDHLLFLVTIIVIGTVYVTVCRFMLACVGA